MRRRVAITGATGRLGTELVGAFSRSGAEVLALAHENFDLTKSRNLDELRRWRPQVVVNAAAWTDVDGCARQPERAMEINGRAAGAVAAAARDVHALVIQVSTNEVFDGEQTAPYLESDAPHPPNAYGLSKLAGEAEVARAAPDHVIVRTAWLFGGRKADFVAKILEAAAHAQQSGRALPVVADEWGNPTPVGWLASAIVGLSEQRVRGVVHLAGQPAVTRLGWAGLILRGSSTPLLPVSADEYERDSTPPLRAVLGSQYRWPGLPDADWIAASRLTVDRLRPAPRA